jgi:hypothetical protein
VKKQWMSHSICRQCWVKQGRPEPTRAVKDAVPGPCCWCEGVHASGLWLLGKHDEAGTECGGSCA